MCTHTIQRCTTSVLLSSLSVDTDLEIDKDRTSNRPRDSVTVTTFHSRVYGFVVMSEMFLCLLVSRRFVSCIHGYSTAPVPSSLISTFSRLVILLSPDVPGWYEDTVLDVS